MSRVPTARVNLARVSLGLLTASALAAAGPAPLLGRDLVNDQNVPAAVKKAIADAYPKAEVIDIGTEKQDGEDVYDVRFKVEKKTPGVYEAEFTPAGDLVEFKEWITVDDLPKTVRSGVESLYPKAAYGSIKRKVHREGGADRVLFIQFSVKGENGAASVSVGENAENIKIHGERIISEKEVPEAVLAAIAKRYPSSKVTAAEKLLEGPIESPRADYEVAIETNGEERTMRFDQGGLLLSEKLNNREEQ